MDCFDAGRFLRDSMSAGLIVRDLRGYAALPESLRVSMGTREQNDTLLRSVGVA
jgi:histidinol-phosphate/aromatic aminotransferase/cobyric acid decarboxylase-like protein